MCRGSDAESKGCITTALYAAARCLACISKQGRPPMSVCLPSDMAAGASEAVDPPGRCYYVLQRAIMCSSSKERHSFQGAALCQPWRVPARQSRRLLLSSRASLYKRHTFAPCRRSDGKALWGITNCNCLCSEKRDAVQETRVILGRWPLLNPEDAMRVM